MLNREHDSPGLEHLGFGLSRLGFRARLAASHPTLAREHPHGLGRSPGHASEYALRWGMFSAGSVGLEGGGDGYSSYSGYTKDLSHDGAPHVFSRFMLQPLSMRCAERRGLAERLPNCKGFLNSRRESARLRNPIASSGGLWRTTGGTKCSSFVLRH
jgi:hypothetical protein